MDNERFEEGFWSRRSVSERAVGPERVVLCTPALDNHLGLPESEEDLSIENFVSELPVEAFAVPVLPGTPRFDEEASHTCSFKPVPYCVCSEFRAVI